MKIPAFTKNEILNNDNIRIMDNPKMDRGSSNLYSIMPNNLLK